MCTEAKGPRTYTWAASSCVLNVLHEHIVIIKAPLRSALVFCAFCRSEVLISWSRAFNLSLFGILCDGETAKLLQQQNWTKTRRALSKSRKKTSKTESRRIGRSRESRHGVLYIEASPRLARPGCTYCLRIPVQQHVVRMQTQVDIQVSNFLGPTAKPYRQGLALGCSRIASHCSHDAAHFLLCPLCSRTAP